MLSHGSLYPLCILMTFILILLYIITAVFNCFAFICAFLLLCFKSAFCDFLRILPYCFLIVNEYGVRILIFRFYLKFIDFRYMFMLRYYLKKCYLEKEEPITKMEKDEMPIGLTSEEAARLKAEGKVNVDDTKSGKSYKRIVLDNLLTFFNLIYAVVTVVLVAVGSFSNLTFLAVVIPNILIAIIQEVRAKMMVDKLSVTTEPRAKVMRDGALTEINAEEIVLGDIVYIEVGNQILADGEVVSGTAEVNESMLTGESNAIEKNSGDKLFAGSFLVGGGAYMKVTAVGKDNYVHKLEKAAKNFKAPQSNLFRDLNKLIKYITIFLVPMAVLLAVSNYMRTADAVDTVVSTSGSIIGMIPAGIYLLITLTLTLSVIVLGKKDTLVQDMYSIEMLASADVVCLDKTGTITDGTMQVTALELLSTESEEEVSEIMAMLEGAEYSINNTSRALIERFGRNTECEITERIAFNSKRKYSGAAFAGKGSYSIGAAGFVKCPVSDDLRDKITDHAKLGERVLLLVKQPTLEEEGHAIALIAITDRIRPNAKETIAKFQEQGVTVKVISGDHAETVSTIAKRVGINNADKFLSCENLSDEELLRVANDYAIYGRVSPEQKVLLVKALRGAGHTVAMTGDGVNDTLALREADCSIAMADGSEVARKVSKIVLMNSDFGTLPDVVREGRRAINNVRMSATLFLMKTILTIALSVFTVCFSMRYPFEPKQMLYLELLVIGLASLALTVEPNNKRIEGSFIKTVIVRSVPNAIALMIPIFLTMILSRFGVIVDVDGVLGRSIVSAICTLSVTFVGFINLLFLCHPYTKWRFYVVLIVFALLVVAFPITIFLLGDMTLVLPAFANLPILFTVLGVGALGALIIHSARFVFKYIKQKRSASFEAV